MSGKNRRMQLISRSSTIARKVGGRAVKKTVVVVCEGAKTEPQYIEGLANDIDVRDVAAVNLRLEAAGQGEVPLTLVNRAIDIRSRARKEGGEVDEIWCVFDVEWPRNHPHLHEAVRRAGENNIHLAISNPCFELWLILHFEDVSKFLDNTQARRVRRRLDAQTGKHVDPLIYEPRRREAVDRAERLAAKHAEDGTHFPHDNPSSGMYRLIQSVSPPSASHDGE